MTAAQLIVTHSLKEGICDWTDLTDKCIAIIC